MAIAKDIAIHHGSHLGHTLSYIDDEKTILSKCGYDVKNMTDDDLLEFRNTASKLNPLFDYAGNTEKTAFVLDGDEEILVSGYQCNPDTASLEFQMVRDKYYRHVGAENRVHGKKMDKETGEMIDKQSIEAYHVIQSFPEIPDLDPRLVHQIGLEFCQKAFPGHKCVVCTHMNTAHLHNHIVVCAYNNNCYSKYKMDMAHRRAYREINDQISVKYGLPILVDPDQEHKSFSWLEWNARQTADSWKQQLRNDIDLARKNTSSWAEYVSFMESAGYKIRQGEKYVTYTMPGQDTRKCRDKLLGPEYMRDAIKRDFGEEPEQAPSEEEPSKIHATEFDRPAKLRVKKISFYVSRYTETGRRRSDLELIFLKAIKIIKHFMNRFFDRDRHDGDPSNPIYARAEIKLRVMEQSLYMCQQLGIENKAQLKEMLNKTGAELSHLKKEASDMESAMEFAEDTAEKIQTLKELQAEVDALGFPADKMFYEDYTDRQIAKNRAEQMPMTSKQRQKLFVTLEDHPDYVLSCSFEEVSYSQAKDIIGFLTGTSDVLPAQLVKKGEPSMSLLERKYDSIRDKQDKNMKERMKGRSCSALMLKKLHTLLDEAGINLDASSLTMYEGSRIIDFLSGNPFPEGRDYVPDPAKPSSPIRSSLAEQIRELEALRNVHVSFPIKSMTQADGEKYFKYLLYQGTEPEPLKKFLHGNKKTNDELFAEAASVLAFPDRQLLARYRAIVNDLRSLGIDASDADRIISDLEYDHLTYSALKERIDGLGKTYRDLSKLNYNSNLAESRAFTNGPLYKTSEEKPEATVVEREASAEVKREDEMIQKTVSKRNDSEPQKKHNFFRDIADGFYDRL